MYCMGLGVNKQKKRIRLQDLFRSLLLGLLIGGCLATSAWIALHEPLSAKRVPGDLSVIIKCTFGVAEVNRTPLNSSGLAFGSPQGAVRLSSRPTLLVT